MDDLELIDKIQKEHGTRNLQECPKCKNKTMKKSPSGLDYGEYCYHCLLCGYFWKTDWATPFGQ